jgi:hypothetical protein
MPPPDPDYRAEIVHQLIVLRGLQTAMDNRMIPRGLFEAVMRGALDGQVDHLVSLVGEPSQIDVIMQAIGIQRGVAGAA